MKSTTKKPTYSLWYVEHESVYTAMLHKAKDTSSIHLLERWMNKSPDNVASFYREEQCINAMYVQTFVNE